VSKKSTTKYSPIVILVLTKTALLSLFKNL